MQLQLSLFEAVGGARRAGTGPHRSVAVIAGSSRGIGYALAEECAAHAHDLVMIGRHAGRLEAAAAAIRATYGIEVWTLPLDVTSPHAGDVLVEFLEQHGLSVGLLINNAAAWSDGAVSSIAPGEAERLVRANIAAAAELTRALLPSMVGRERCRILVVGSLAGEMPAPGNAIYSATKAFLKVWTLALRHELRPRGISVSLLLPGAVATEFTGVATDAEAASARALLASSPRSVAWCGYRGTMAGESVIVPGLVNRIMYFGIKILPQRLLVRLRAWGSAPAGVAAASPVRPVSS